MADKIPLDKLLHAAQEAALGAGKILRNFWGKEFKVYHKGEVDLVTEVDLLAFLPSPFTGFIPMVCSSRWSVHPDGLNPEGNPEGNLREGAGGGVLAGRLVSPRGFLCPSL